MCRTEETSQEKKNKTLIRSFIQEIFNEQNSQNIEHFLENQITLEHCVKING